MILCEKLAQRLGIQERVALYEFEAPPALERESWVQRVTEEVPALRIF